MSLITKIPGVTFTDTSLPKLYRDSAITAGCLWAHDALDTYSWPSQSAPLSGQHWVDMSPIGSDSIAPSSGIGFSAGFTKAAAGYFTNPVSGKVAGGADGFLYLLWLKHATQPTTGNSGIAGLFDSNALHQYGIVCSNNVSNGDIKLWFNGIYLITIPAVAAGTILQLGLALKKVGGVYTALGYKNGVLIGSSASAGASILQPTATTPRLGNVQSGSYTDTWAGTFYRDAFFETSALANQAAITALVLKDYNANVGRFS